MISDNSDIKDFIPEVSIRTPDVIENVEEIDPSLTPT